VVIRGLRKSFDGLSGIIHGNFGGDPADGRLFLFVNKRRDQIKALWRARVSLSFQTDNRLMSCISHTGEAVRLVQEAGFTVRELGEMMLQATDHSFLGDAVRKNARAAVRDWMAAVPD
jgi:adenosine deaminase